MKIGLLDEDNKKNLNKCFPNLPLMKLSAWHKQNGDEVEFYSPDAEYDRVYVSKVFSFSDDTSGIQNAKEIVRGGSGYHIATKDGREIYGRREVWLPDEIEHIFPDYSLYGDRNTAYGFLTRGCPRGCGFCIVGRKEGSCSHRVASLSEFWNGQKHIEVLDPNTLACAEWRGALEELQASGATVNFNQGVDIRLMTEEKADALRRIKVKGIHFAFDTMKNHILTEHNLKAFQRVTGWDRHKVTVYVLTNFNTTLEEDLYRVNFIKCCGFQPYIMRYNRACLPRNHVQNKLARYVNTKRIFWTVDSFAHYLRIEKELH